MIAGHLQEKRGYWYAVLTYSENGKTKSKWFSTGLRIKNNKKKAEAFLLVKRMELSGEAKIKPSHRKQGRKKSKEDYMSMSSLCEKWIKYKKAHIAETTYSGYLKELRNHLLPYFSMNSIPVKDVNAEYVQNYIDHAYGKGLSHKTVKNHRGILSNIFKYAIMTGKLNQNPMKQLEPAPKTQPVENYYTASELVKLMECAKGTILEYPIFMACVYGLRRSEICGLKWSAIDLDNDIFTINHVVTEAAEENGHIKLIAKDETKNKHSKSFPLIHAIKEMLLNIMSQQIENGTYKENGYVYLDTDGALVRPDYVSHTFVTFLKKQKLRKIRFHDLRHSCASVLLSDPNRDISLKDIQLWLGHRDIQSTMRYAHISDISAKQHTVKRMEELLYSAAKKA